MSKRNEYRKDAVKLMKDALDNKNKEVNLYNKDGWKNAITGLGTAQSKSSYTTYSGYEILTEKVLTQIWIGGGIGKRIVEVIPDDMTREWITIENDTESVLENKLESLSVQKNFNIALKWQRLLGGSLIVMGINDGREIEEPVNVNAIKSVDYLRVFDKTEIAITNVNFFTDPSDPDFGKVEFYTVTPSFGGVFNVHRDRVLEFKGEPVPSNEQHSEWWYWGMSVLQSIWDDLKDFGASRKHIVDILYEFVIGVYKLEDLANLLAEGNEDILKTRMNAIDLSKSTIQSVLLGENEDFYRNSASVSGLPELLDRFMMFVSGLSGIPVTRLFGRSPSGQNATGESDLINYYDMIKPKQDNDMKPQLMKLINYINISKEIGNKRVQDPMVKFKKLFQLTESQEIQNRKIQSEIDNTYLNQGVLNADEVRESRFSKGYSYETTIDEDREFEEDTTVTTEQETQEQEEE